MYPYWFQGDLTLIIGAVIDSMRNDNALGVRAKIMIECLPFVFSVIRLLSVEVSQHLLLLCVYTQNG